MFMNLYNFEVIDEDAFLQWKEELNDVHPGKGKALFQVWGPGCTLCELQIVTVTQVSCSFS